MTWKLPEKRQSEYESLLKNAQDLDATLGSTQYRLYKMCKMREELDGAIKMFWDQVIKELGLDPKVDYIIKPDGVIELVENNDQALPVNEEVKEKESQVGINVEDLK